MSKRLFRALFQLSLFVSPLLLLVAYLSPASARDFEEQCILNTALSDDFDGESLANKWTLYRPDPATIAVEDSRLVLTAVEESVWLSSKSAPLVYQEVSGDVTVLSTAHARRASDPSKTPDKQYQYGGLMLRDPVSEDGDENYVFVVLGVREPNARLNIEVKSTTDNDSKADIIDWSSGDAELRIDRNGSKIILSAREIGKPTWQLLKTYNRPDLPDTLQAGVIAYAFSHRKGIFDFQMSFEQVEYWTGCESGGS